MPDSSEALLLEATAIKNVFANRVLPRLFGGATSVDEKQVPDGLFFCLLFRWSSPLNVLKQVIVSSFLTHDELLKIQISELWQVKAVEL